MKNEYFGPFQLLERLGQGGVAEAFVAVRGRATAGAPRVCIKRALPAFASDPDTDRLFAHEAEVARRLSHPHVVKALSHGNVDGLPFLELELVSGLNLRELMQALRRQGQRLSAGEVVAIARALSSALAAAHGATRNGAPSPIVHRDVSSSNVLIGQDGNVKLTDFAIAKAMGDGQHTATGVIKGTISYMAPEYARSGDVDERCDQFSLGVLLFEALAGERPYDGATELSTLERATRGEHEPLSRLVPGAPPDLVDVIERLIRPDPAARFSSTADLREALEQLPSNEDAAGALSTRVRLFAPEIRQRRQSERGHASSGAPRGRLAARLRARRTELQLTAIAAFVVGALVVAIAVLPGSGADPTEPAREPGSTAAATPAPSRTVASARPAGAAPPKPTPAQPSPPSAGTSPPATTTLPPAPPVATAPPAPPVASPIASPPRSPPGEPPPSVTPPPAPSTRESRRPATDRGRPPSPPAPPARATLSVIVIPFGSVWIDGKARGEAPLEASLPPGRHTVAVGRKGPEKTRTIELSAGEARRLVLR